jgi:hypothetical protein
MRSFEDDLKDALKRREPSAGFAERVMARVPQAKPRHWFLRWIVPDAGAFRWAPAIGALLLVLLFTGAFTYERRLRSERAAAEQAKRELLEALDITSAKLQEAKARVLKRTGGRI